MNIFALISILIFLSFYLLCLAVFIYTNYFSDNITENFNDSNKSSCLDDLQTLKNEIKSLKYDFDKQIYQEKSNYRKLLEQYKKLIDNLNKSIELKQSVNKGTNDLLSIASKI